MTPAGAEGVDAGWLPGALQMPSPNCDERPPDEVVRLVVIHAISLPPVSSADPESSTCFPIDWIRRPIPISASSAACAFRRIFLFAGTAP